MLDLFEDLGNNLCFEGLEDEEIVQIARTKNPLAMEYLMSKYKCFVRNKSRSYFMTGGDRDDIIQEGMIGLYKAIRDYDIDKPASFKSFAEICITRQILTAIKTATRQKHIPLNSYVSLNKPVYNEDSERTLLDMIQGSRETDPMELFIVNENVKFVEMKMAEILSDLEMEVFKYYVEGKSYEEIAVEVNKDLKSIDNALQRVKKKLDKKFL